MDYYCDVCDKYIKTKSKYQHFKSNIHREFTKGKHTILFHKDTDINDVDDAFYAYIIQHIKIFEYYLVKNQFILVFIDYQLYRYATSKIYDINTMISWTKFLEKKYLVFLKIKDILSIK